LVSQVVQAQAPATAPEKVCVKTTFKPLPGGLDKVEMLNSNSPEVVQSEGILTAPKHQFNGKFDVFVHHISKQDPAQNLPTLYIGIVLLNPSGSAATVKTLAGASYLSQPDAPFVSMPPVTDNAEGEHFSGPGDRVMNDVLRGKLQESAVSSTSVTVPANGFTVLSSLPIPVRGLTPLLNGRSTLLRVQSDKPVQIATLAKYATVGADGAEVAPTDSQWNEVLKKGLRAGPPDKTPTPPASAGPIVYGRVAGVQRGTQWTAEIPFKITDLGQSVSYPVSTVAGAHFGTGHVQSAALIERETDTAYAAHGNYGVKYDITIAMENASKKNAMALVKLQTPLKASGDGMLNFNKTMSPRVFFRGTVKTSYVDAQGIRHEKYTHLVQHEGEQGTPLVAQFLLPRERRTVQLEFLYPPDASPPQVLTLESVDPDSLLD
jgi:hypothetical protein